MFTGRPQFLPIPKTSAGGVQPIRSYEAAGGEVCRFYAKQFGIRVTIIRPFNVYGAGQNGNFLIPTLLRQVLDPEARKSRLPMTGRAGLSLDD